MKFEFDLRVGDRVIRITDEAATPAEWFQKMSFYDTIPVAGPNGEAELRFSFRTPQGYEYYSIECRDAGQEFKFGQLKEARGVMPKGSFFPKTWEPILHGVDHHEEEEESRSEEPPEPAPKQQETRQSKQSSKPDPLADVKQNDNVDLDKLAKRFASEDRVSRDKNGAYKVTVNNKVEHEIWRNESGRVVCQCDRFKEHGAKDAAFRCEHIRAVALKFAKPQQVAV